MSPKQIWSILLIFLVIALGIFFYPNLKNYFNKTQTQKPSENNKVHVPLYNWGGTITKVNADSIVVANKGPNGVTMYFEFKIAPDTKITKKTAVFTTEQLKSSGVFSPKLLIESGNFADFKVGQQITDLKTNADIYSATAVKAAQLTILIYDFPKQ
jgi:hypothetical protein